MTHQKEVTHASVQYLAPPLATSLNAALALFGAQISPVWTILFSSAYGLFGFYLFYNQARINEFVLFIKDNLDKFAEDVINQPALEKGFIIIFETYLKTRDEKKWI